MKILFIAGNDELATEEWEQVPRMGDRVQIERGEEVLTFFVRAVIWKKDFVRVHVTRDRE